ncbi:hypothetical protein [Pseudomonas sp. S2_E01]
MIIQDCLARDKPRLTGTLKAPANPTNGDINFTSNAREQIATLRKWRAPDVRAGS